MKKAHGFTIVELLIVIVVIAILAAISIAAYTGIQDRAQRAGVQSDIRNLAQKIDILQIDTGGVVTLGSENGGSYRNFPGIEFSPSKDLYAAEGNIYICKLQSGGDYIAIGAKTKAGEVIAYRSDKGFFEYSGDWTVSSTICPNLLGQSGSFYFSYGRTTAGSWNDWTN